MVRFLEYLPGHGINLDILLTFDDDPACGELTLVFGGGAVGPMGLEPYVLHFYGPQRAGLLSYFRATAIQPDAVAGDEGHNSPGLKPRGTKCQERW